MPIGYHPEVEEIFRNSKKRKGKTMSKRPYSETNYWVRVKGEDVWEDASQYKKYTYGEFYNAEEVAIAYLQYMDQVGYYEDISAEDISIEVLDGRDMMVKTYDAYIEFRPEYYANFKEKAPYNEDEENAT